VVENRMPRPRDYRSPDLQRLVDQLHDIITGSEMPDVAPPVAVPGVAPIEPLPEASPSEIVGLLEYLDARGGKEELFRIVADTRREFGQIISVVKATEMLDLVDTPKRMVILADEGRRYLKAPTPEERNRIWREQLVKLRLFRDLDDILSRQPNHEVERDFVFETIALALPEENYGRVFNTLVKWASAGELFEYDEDREVLRRPGATGQPSPQVKEARPKRRRRKVDKPPEAPPPEAPPPEAPPPADSAGAAT
jgi:NitT/TauT family transport system ATP-binding protein